MPRYEITARVQVSHQADGSYMAMSRDLPLMAVAPDLDELKARVDRGLARFASYLATLPEAEARAFLDERGAAYRSIDAGDDECLDYSVLVCA